MTVVDSTRVPAEKGSTVKSLFTSESVSMGHPDKIADQISDAILDSLITHDPQARTAIETLVTTGLVVLAGEVAVHARLCGWRHLRRIGQDVEDAGGRGTRQMRSDRSPQQTSCEKSAPDDRPASGAPFLPWSVP